MISPSLSNFKSESISEKEDPSVLLNKLLSVLASSLNVNNTNSDNKKIEQLNILLESTIDDDQDGTLLKNGNYRLML